MSTIKTINGVFAAHGVQALAYAKSNKTSYRAIKTPSYIAYPIYLWPGTKVSDVVRLKPEIEQALSGARRKSTTLRFGQNPLTVEVPRENPEPLLCTNQELGNLRPYQILVGKSWASGRPRNIVLSLDDPNESHVFVAGQTGCGKSMLMASMVRSIAMSTSPVQLHMVLVDLKGTSLRSYDKMPHVLFSAYKPEQAVSAISYVFKAMRHRIETGKIGGHRIVLFIDELRELKYVDAKVLGEYLPRIVALGREMGVHVVAATQYPLSSDIGSITKSQFPVRIVGSVSDSNTARHTTGIPRSGAEGLGGNGSMLLIHNAEPLQRIQTYLVESPDPTPQMVAGRWGESVRQEVPVVTMGEQEPVRMQQAPSFVIDNDQYGKDLRMARPVFDRYYDRSTGQLRYGAKSAILRTIRGEDIRLHGSYVPLVNRIIKELSGE